MSRLSELVERKKPTGIKELNSAYNSESSSPLVSRNMLTQLQNSVILQYGKSKNDETSKEQMFIM